MNAMNPVIHLGSFTYDYPEGVRYEVRCDDDTVFHWRCVRGENQGREGTEWIDRVQLHPQQHLLSWTEADGLTVTQVVDYDAGRVDTVLVFNNGGRKVMQGWIRRNP